MVVIAFFELEPWEKELVKRALSKHKLLFFDEHLTEKHLIKLKNTEVIGIFIYSVIDEKILKKLPRLKLITTMSTGFDHIDLSACKKRNITVCNVPAYGVNTVAEHTFALLLALTRNIVKSVERTRKGNFDLTGLRGIDLKEKTLGVIGTGKIGKWVIKIAKGFDMNVIATDPAPDKLCAEEMNFEYVSLNTLLKKSDIITLHAPYTKKNHHLLDSKNMKLIKKGTILLNTARGGLIETKAILEGLQSGKLCSVGLDVLEEECAVKEEKQLLSKIFQKTCDVETVLQEHMLLQHENVLITPHNAFNSEEALKRIIDTTIENIKMFLKKSIINSVYG